MWDRFRNLPTFGIAYGHVRRVPWYTEPYVNKTFSMNSIHEFRDKPEWKWLVVYRFLRLEKR